jgi:hypothetical protein
MNVRVFFSDYKIGTSYVKGRNLAAFVLLQRAHSTFEIT